MPTGQPGHGLVDRLDAGAHGVDLSGQPRQAFAAVGFGAQRRPGGRVRPRRRRARARSVRCGPPPAGCGTRPARRAAAAPGVGDLLGLGLQGFGVGAAGRLGLGVEVLGALAGDAHRRADPFGQRRQPEPGLLGGLGALAEACRPPLRGRSVRRSWPRAGSAASSCSRRSVVSAWSVSSNSALRVTRSSAASRSRASRRSAWMVWARRAISAWRPSGLSWRRSSVVRSVSRARLADIESSLRTAFSLRLRCLSTPAASSMNARRSSGPRLEDLGELALADDDVHLAADAGVATAVPAHPSNGNWCR